MLASGQNAEHPRGGAVHAGWQGANAPVWKRGPCKQLIPRFIGEMGKCTGTWGGQLVAAVPFHPVCLTSALAPRPSQYRAAALQDGEQAAITIWQFSKSTSCWRLDNASQQSVHGRLSKIRKFMDAFRLVHESVHGRLFFKKKVKSVGRFQWDYLQITTSGLFCKNLLHVILTPPGRHQHPHDNSNPPVASRLLVAAAVVSCEPTTSGQNVPLQALILCRVDLMEKN
jgi:hypothetical protein